MVFRSYIAVADSQDGCASEVKGVNVEDKRTMDNIEIGKPINISFNFGDSKQDDCLNKEEFTMIWAKMMRLKIRSNDLK